MSIENQHSVKASANNLQETLVLLGFVKFLKFYKFNDSLPLTKSPGGG